MSHFSLEERTKLAHEAVEWIDGNLNGPTLVYLSGEEWGHRFQFHLGPLACFVKTYPQRYIFHPFGSGFRVSMAHEYEEEEVEDQEEEDEEEDVQQDDDSRGTPDEPTFERTYPIGRAVPNECWNWQEDGLAALGAAKECWHWQRLGSCRFGERCKFAHAGIQRPTSTNPIGAGRSQPYSRYVRP